MDILLKRIFDMDNYKEIAGLDLTKHMFEMHSDKKLKLLTTCKRPPVAGIQAEFYFDDQDNTWLFFEFCRPYKITRYFAMVPQSYGKEAAVMFYETGKENEYAIEICKLAKRAIKDAYLWQSDKSTTRLGGIDLDTFFTISAEGMFRA